MTTQKGIFKTIFSRINDYRVITNVNNAVIEATPYKDSSMILFLTKFSSLNAFDAPAEKLKTTKRNEIGKINSKNKFVLTRN